jgi:hypothetical protein
MFSLREVLDKRVHKLAPLSESMVGKVIIWSAFTSNSTDRAYVIENFIQEDDNILFEIAVLLGDVAVPIQNHSEYSLESEILIATVHD